MSGNFSGLDLEAVRSMARQFDASAEQMELIRAALAGLVTQAAWVGMDSSEFSSRWEAELGPALAAAAEALRDAGSTARANADQQEAVSNDLDDGSSSKNGRHKPRDRDGDDGGFFGWLGDRAGDLWEAGGDAVDWLGDRAGDAVDWLSDRPTAVVDDWMNFGDHLGNFWDATGGSMLNGEMPRVTEVIASSIGVIGSGWGAMQTTRTGGLFEANVFDDGRPVVGEPVEITNAPRPVGLADYLKGVTDAYKHDGTVQITTVTDENGHPSYVVTIPGTETWNPLAGKNSQDVTGNIITAGGGRSTMTEAVMLAIEKNVPAGADVMLVGHSQGGMTAVDIAADPQFAAEYEVTHVVTYGSPVENTAVPPGTSFLNLQHGSDVVPMLDLNGLRIDGSQSPTQGSNITTVTLNDPARDVGKTVLWGAIGGLPGVGVSDVINNHSHENYSNSVHESIDPNLARYLSDPSLDQYFAPSGPSNNRGWSTVEVPIGRADR